MRCCARQPSVASAMNREHLMNREHHSNGSGFPGPQPRALRQPMGVRDQGAAAALPPSIGATCEQLLRFGKATTKQRQTIPTTRSQADDLRRPRRAALPLYGSAAVSVIALHLVTNGTLGFHIDELYYLACGRHLAFGYVDF